MKNLFLLALIILSVLSCNGNKTKQDTLKVSVEKFKGSLTLLEITEYFPKDYSETKTDTILSNGFTIKIKNYTDMKSSVLQSFELDSIKYTHHYRKIVSEIIVIKDNKQIFNKIIDEGFLSKSESDYIINDVSIDELKSIETNKVHLVASQCTPRTVNCPIYNIIIDEKGNFELKKTDHART